MAGRLTRSQDASNPIAWTETSLWLSYVEILEILEGGDCARAALVARDLRDRKTGDAAELIRRLIATRIALKTSHARTEYAPLTRAPEEAPWIVAESEFVDGLLRFHQGDFVGGTTSFESAERRFAELGMPSRELLSAYNALIGKSYSTGFANAREEFTDLTMLESRLRRVEGVDEREAKRVRKVLAMVYRQKAAVLERDKRLNAALNELNRAIDIFSVDGPVSDHHLALLQAADLSLELGDHRGATTFFEYVIPPLDTRVEFPYAFILWRLEGKPLVLSQFSVVPPVWKERYEAMSQEQKNESSLDRIRANASYVWDTSRGSIFDKSTAKKWSLRTSSLEGSLVLLLSKRHSTKSLLIEALWPEDYEVRHLDHRLHQLVSRTNIKIPGLIVFDGVYYRLSGSIEVID